MVLASWCLVLGDCCLALGAWCLLDDADQDYCPSARFEISGPKVTIFVLRITTRDTWLRFLLFGIRNWYSPYNYRLAMLLLLRWHVCALASSLLRPVPSLLRCFLASFVLVRSFFLCSWLRLVLGVWCLVFGAWRLVFGVW